MRISDWSSDVCSSDLFDQRQYDQNRRRVEGPFADRLREAAKALQQGKDALMQLALTGPSRRLDRKSAVEGKRVSVRVDRGGRRIIKKTKLHRETHTRHVTRV